MTKFLLAPAIVAASFLGLGQAAQAQSLYQNGSMISTLSGWSISNGDAVSNSFVLGSDATVGGIEFGALLWGFDTDHTTYSTIDWAITTSASDFSFGTNSATLATGTANVTGGTQTAVADPYGDPGNVFWVSTNSFSLPAVSLTAGTYYLVLRNAVVSNGASVQWLENNGASTARVSYGTAHDIPFYIGGGSHSEYFQVFAASAETASVPEPASWALMLGGFGLVGGAMRSRRKTAVRFG
jgi:hypothetical protein